MLHPRMSAESMSFKALAETAVCMQTTSCVETVSEATGTGVHTTERSTWRYGSLLLLVAIASAAIHHGGSTLNLPSALIHFKREVWQLDAMLATARSIVPHVPESANNQSQPSLSPIPTAVRKNEESITPTATSEWQNPDGRDWSEWFEGGWSSSPWNDSDPGKWWVRLDQLAQAINGGFGSLALPNSINAAASSCSTCSGGNNVFTQQNSASGVGVQNVKISNIQLSGTQLADMINGWSNLRNTGGGGSCSSCNSCSCQAQPHSTTTCPS